MLEKQTGFGHCVNIKTSIREGDKVDEIIYIDQARDDEGYIKIDASWRGNDSHYIQMKFEFKKYVKNYNK